LAFYLELDFFLKKKLNSRVSSLSLSLTSSFLDEKFGKCIHHNTVVEYLKKNPDVLNGKRVTKKYKQLAMQNHPDKLRRKLWGKRGLTTKELKDANEVFKRITLAGPKAGVPPVFSLANRAAKLRWSAENRHR
jgi:hypothetical protein